MKQSEPRFFAVEHTTLMFLAVVCAHVGGALSRKGRTDLKKIPRRSHCVYTFSALDARRDSVVETAVQILGIAVSPVCRVETKKRSNL